MLQVYGVQSCQIGSGSECEKAPFVPGHNLAGEGFDVVRMRRTGAYVINVKGHLTDNNTCTLCPNRFQNGQVKTVTLIFHTIILCSFSSAFTCDCPFISLLDSEASGSSAWLASLQPLQQATLQCPPPLCGLPTAQLQLTGQQQLGPGFEFGELWQRSIGRKPLWPSKVCPFTAQCRQGHLCHSWDWLYLLQVRSGVGKMLFKT